MNHHNSIRKFNRDKNQRKALLKTLAVSLVSKGKIQTTLPKAKELRPFTERLITYGKKGTLSGQRELIALIGKNPTKKILSELAPKYKDRNGGYTRITKLGIRKSDASPRAQIEFV